MYANVQKAAGPGHRVLVVARVGHTAILKDLLATDGQRQSDDVNRYLAPRCNGQPRWPLTGECWAGVCATGGLDCAWRATITPNK